MMLVSKDNIKRKGERCIMLSTIENHGDVNDTS